jgi:hypothetical protein
MWPAQYNANANGKDALTVMIVTEAIVEHLPPDHLYLLAARWVSGLRGFGGCRLVWLCLAVFVDSLTWFPVDSIIPYHVVACYSARLRSD